LNFNKKIWLLILFGSLLRIWVAASLELGNDEVYYQAYARHLQWNYFDHPPMVALLIRLTTFNLFFDRELFIRLGPILCAAAGTRLIFEIGTLVKNQRTGWIAAILYNTSFYSSIIAGTFILPDSPQVLFWLLSVYFMIRIVGAGKRSNQMLYFILLGISTGLCIMSKVHGVFLWFGFGGYIIFYQRHLLKSSAFWASVIISLVIIFPVFWWNYENHFITYQYHQGRINFWGKQPDLDHLMQQVAGSIFYNNPVNFILCVLTLYTIAKKKTRSLPKEYPLFLWLGLPLILVLLWTSFFSETLPHWSGPAWLSLMIPAACYLDGIPELRKRSRWLYTAAWLYGCVVILGVLAILYLPFRIGSDQPGYLGKGDVTLDMTGWRRFSRSLDSLYHSDSSSGLVKPVTIILSDYWFPAAHLDHYYAIPYRHNLLAIGPISDIHHFAWMNQRRPRILPGSDAYFIYPSNYYGPPTAFLKNKFRNVGDSILITQYRSGRAVRNFVIYRMHGFRGDSLDYLVPGIR
jgi:4-amino-4-deoxy-L-arabinose transferase-like glycosyltransferase